MSLAPTPMHKGYFEHVKPLIVCRGPVRLEALQVFHSMGTRPAGILLSQKDSIQFPYALAPEVRLCGRQGRAHHIDDYGPKAGQQAAHIQQIINIARKHQYTHIFAGYGFMAEDETFIAAIEQSGLLFIGPSSTVARLAGNKDSARRIATQVEVAVAEGVDQLLALALLSTLPTNSDQKIALQALAKQHGVALPIEWEQWALVEQANWLEGAARQTGVELVSIHVLKAEAQRQVERMLAQYPNQSLRFKHVAGGGGKGQRVIHSAAQVERAVDEVLQEAGAVSTNSNRNFLIERNISPTRHVEVQLLGNSQWCVALGARDCSVQMHEQKLLEIFISAPQLRKEALARADQPEKARVLQKQAELLTQIEAAAVRFGKAVGLDSVSTFECIVSGDEYFFMEMNTRIQVEHRITEQALALEFEHIPQPKAVSQPLTDEKTTLTPSCLIETMLWVCEYGAELSVPILQEKSPVSAEVRINATDDGLHPQPGGQIAHWSAPIEGELRDDQGIALPNPDTKEWIPYRLSGAYDSNIALVVANGENREHCLQNLAEQLRVMTLRGRQLFTNRDFQLGFLWWVLASDGHALPHTKVAESYLAAVGALQESIQQMALPTLWQWMLEEIDEPSTKYLQQKQTLLLRPMEAIFKRPHLLYGWLAQGKGHFWQVGAGNANNEAQPERVFRWLKNPLEALRSLYYALHWEKQENVEAEAQIWAHDHHLLEQGTAFYHSTVKQLQHYEPEANWDDWRTLSKRLEVNAPPSNVSVSEWQSVQAAHRGHQLGLHLLGLPALLVAQQAALEVKGDLSIEIPAYLAEIETAKRLRAKLESRPVSSENVILAPSGGMFYNRPAPDQPCYVEVGDGVEEGQVVGLLEVMKMFNPLRVPRAGLIKNIHDAGENGMLVNKGQCLVELEPVQDQESSFATASSDAETQAVKAEQLKLLTLKTLYQGLTQNR